MFTNAIVLSTQLPYDLERTIIEYAAETDQFMALKLMLVSREVKRWAEPILYRHIKLQSSSQADAFIRNLDTMCSKSLVNTIRSLSFTYGATFHQAAKILSACTGVTRLASQIEFSQRTFDITLDDVADFGRFVTAQSPALRRLSVTLQPICLCPDPSFRIPLFHHLTHLSIFGASEHCHKWSWASFDVLEHLTHFALEVDTSTNLRAVHNLISRFPPLLHVCLVILSVKDGQLPLEQYLVDNKEVQQMVLGETDRRIAVGTTQQLESREALSWDRGLIHVSLSDDILNGEEIWAKVENFINTRVPCPDRN